MPRAPRAACAGAGRSGSQSGSWRALCLGSGPTGPRGLGDRAIAGAEPADRRPRSERRGRDPARRAVLLDERSRFAETSELTTPATIGWRRPLLLLPADWRDWSPAERRAVLAHELAHVCRGDFLAGLAAQLSLALHFYHPLAHWLAARLRLEQELAADAWGARLSGGKQRISRRWPRWPCAATAAPSTWPARAFLPSRGTFVRRIEMLQKHDQIRHAPLPSAGAMPHGRRARRAGPSGGRRCAGQRGRQRPGPGSDDTRPGVQPGTDSRTDDESYNLAFLPADAKMVVAVRPEALLGRREIRTLLESLKQSPVLKGLLIVPPEDIEQLLVFWEGIPRASGGDGQSRPLVPFPSGGVLRMSKPQDWKAIVKKRTRFAAGSPSRRPDLFPHRQRDHGPDWSALCTRRSDAGLRAGRPAPRADRGPKSPGTASSLGRSLEKGRQGSGDGGTRNALAAAAARPGTARPDRRHRTGTAADLTLETISPLLDKAQSYALGIDASRGLTVDLVAAAGTEDNAKPVADTLQALLTLGKNAVQGMRRDLPRPMPLGEAVEWIARGCRFPPEPGRTEHVGGLRPSDMRSPRSTSPRASSSWCRRWRPRMAAAPRNEHEQPQADRPGVSQLSRPQTATFPAPVLYGGTNKSIPYSWRVAILPYLEENALVQRSTTSTSPGTAPTIAS